MSRVRRSRGFTLLEAMIAMAILAGALTWISVGVIRSMRAETHAKMITAATALARTRMDEFEDELYEKGFGTFDKDQEGTFSDQGFPKYAWRIQVEKVELPSSEQLQTALTKAQEAKQALTGQPASGDDKSKSSNDTAGANPLSSSASGLASQFGLIKPVLEEGIRRVTLTVSWVEGSKTMSIPVVAYYTDVRSVDQAIQLSIPTNLPGMGGAPGGAGTGTGTGTATGTTTGSGK